MFLKENFQYKQHSTAMLKRQNILEGVERTEELNKKQNTRRSIKEFTIGGVHKTFHNSAVQFPQRQRVLTTNQF
jgi:hypothetical protein